MVIGSLVVVLVAVVLSASPTGIVGLLLGRGLQGMGLAVASLTLAVARDVWTGDRLVSRLSLLSVAPSSKRVSAIR